MKRFALAAIILTMAAAGFGQPQGQPQQPWSEQLPIPQYPQAGPGPQAPQLGAPQGAPEDDGSAPDRGVARVSSMNGNVSVRRGDSGEMVAAVVNAPLVAGDRIVTSDTGRAEVQFDALNVIRLAPATEVRLSSSPIIDIKFKSPPARRFSVWCAIPMRRWKSVRRASRCVR